MKRVPWWGWVALVAVLAWAVSPGSADVEAPARSVPSATASAQPTTGSDSDHSTPVRRDRDHLPPTKPQQRPDPPPEPTPEPEPVAQQATGHTFLVVHVVDGDTLDLGNGERVRLVGIDTPEVGECGYESAATALSRLVLDRRVRLTVSDEDRDRYDRLLRYVDVGRTDAGLQLIRQGLAIARYDSRDGYGFHPREPAYLAADRGTRPVCTRPAPAPVQPAPAKNCAPGYSPCVPPAPPDLDCADVNGPVRVTGSDPHRLDGDGDGVACE